MLPQLRDLRSPLDSPRLQALVAGLGEHDAQATLLAQALVEQPPVLARDDGVFADDHDAELAELRRLSTSAAQFLVALEQREREAYGIPTQTVCETAAHGSHRTNNQRKTGQTQTTATRRHTTTRN